MEIRHCSAEVVYHENSNVFSQINYFVSVEVTLWPRCIRAESLEGPAGANNTRGHREQRGNVAAPSALHSSGDLLVLVFMRGLKAEVNQIGRKSR